MPVYSCTNCHNLKTRVITKISIANVDKQRILNAISNHDIDSLGLMFPFNLTVYKRLKKNGECKIIFCSENQFKRDLYIYRDNLDLANIYPYKKSPCPKYK